MNRTVVLVYPRTGAYDRITGSIPYSLLYLIAGIQGFDFQIIDQRVHYDWKNRLAGLLKQGALCVGITSMTGPQIANGLEVSRFVKKHSKAPVVWGGVHPSIAPASTIRSKAVDYVVEGNGGIPFEQLLRALAESAQLNDIPNLHYKANGKPHSNSSAVLPIKGRDVTSAYRFVDLNSGSPMRLPGLNSTSLFTSLGCPYDCNYCSNSSTHFRKWTPFNPRTVIKNVRYLKNRGFNFFYFLDDNLLVDKSRAMSIFRLVAPLKIKWAAGGVSVNDFLKLSEPELAAMLDSGCHSLEFGLESFNPRLLRLLNKPADAGQNWTLVKRMKRFPIIKKYNILIGVPTQLKKEILSEVKACVKLLDSDKRAYVLMNPYLPYPGTKLFNLAVEMGFKPPRTLAGWSKIEMGSMFERPWLKKRDQKLLESLYFLFPFYNKSANIKFTTRFGRLLFSLYHPIARFRIKNKLFSPLPEYALLQLLK